MAGGVADLNHTGQTPNPSSKGEQDDLRTTMDEPGAQKASRGPPGGRTAGLAFTGLASSARSVVQGLGRRAQGLDSQGGIETLDTG